MKLKFNKIETTKDSISIFDGEDTITIPRSDFEALVLAPAEESITISNNVKSLVDITITGHATHKTTYAKELEQKCRSNYKEVVDLPKMSIEEYRSFIPEENKLYTIHLTEENLTQGAGSYENDFLRGFTSSPFIRKVIIEDGVTVLPDYTFSDRVGTVILPSSITEAGSSSFDWVHTIDKIIYKGTVEQFSHVFRRVGLDCHCFAYCNDGRVEFYSRPR